MGGDESFRSGFGYPDEVVVDVVHKDSKFLASKKSVISEDICSVFFCELWLFRSWFALRA